MRALQSSAVAQLPPYINISISQFPLLTNIRIVIEIEIEIDLIYFPILGPRSNFLYLAQNDDARVVQII
jgi:hypothetical protein